MARIKRIQKAIPDAQITVAARMCFSSMTILVPKALKMASAKDSRVLPCLFAQIQVIDFPTDIAVFGILRMMFLSVPTIASIFEIEYPVTVEIITCFSLSKCEADSRTLSNCEG